jgi:tRNA (guanine-N7-)-methyltransferase
MARGKLSRFEQNKEAKNVIEPHKPLFANLKGKWRDTYFQNTHPIVLELACGRGEYTTGLAEIYPDKNFIGVDVKGDRLWKGSQVAIEKGLHNVAFLRIRIEELHIHFAENEVDEIWIIQPDPRPKERDARRRLTSPRFLHEYQKIIKQDATMRLKTDNDILFDYSLALLQSEVIKPIVKNLVFTHDLYQSPLAAEHHNIHTKYETEAITHGLKIKYLRFCFDKKAWQTEMYVRTREDEEEDNQRTEKFENYLKQMQGV